MVLGKSPRMDNRRSLSSCCSTVTLVTFVALCLVGVWIMTSSTVTPIDLATTETNSEVQKQVLQSDRPIDDGSADIKEKVETYTTSNQAPEESNPADSQSQGLDKKSDEIKVQEALEENSVKEIEDKKDGSEDASKGQSYNDGNWEAEGDDSNNDGRGANTDGSDGVSQEKNGEQNPNDADGQNGNINDEKVQNEDKYNSGGKPTQEERDQGQIDQKVGGTESKETEQSFGDKKPKEQSPSELLPDPAQSELLNETHTTGSWLTQAMESKKETETQKQSGGQIAEYSWKLCNVSAGPDYIPCLDNIEAIKKLHSTKHYEHRERHCPEEGPTCLVHLPEGYKRSVKWSDSRNKIWYANVPHTKLAVIKGHQNWIKVTGEYLTFPGGGTQFTHGALHYIDFIQESLPDISWGKKSRVVLDVGCGVASFGGYLFERDVLTMSFAPKDEHEAQVQFALERGIPGFSAVMGTKRLPFPSRVFDVVHCARCRVPWHIEGGMLLLELNRLLRPGGYFVWSATPVYRKNSEDVGIWQAMSELTKSMCWELVSKSKDHLNQAGMAIYRKPSSNECYDKRMENDPPLCQDSDDPNAAWNVLLQACMHRVPEDPSVRGSQWPNQWPKRLETPPYWLNRSQIGVYGQPAPEDFKADYEHWKRVVSKSYLNGMGINWSNVRNVMDMRSVYGGFAGALRDMNVWVMNVVSVHSADTLPIIYDRGLFGMYHDWCESFSTYPRTYDLLHADHLFSKIKKRCKLLAVMAEADRILRPEGKIIVRDNVETINELEQIARSLQWKIQLTYSKEKEGLLCMQKTTWRPQEVDTSI